MKIRKTCSLATLYADWPKQLILENSPELLFIRAVCNGFIDDALSFFCEKQMFGDVPPVVDAPYGRFAGLSEIRSFSEGWLGTFNASSASVTPMFQTRSGGRSVTEMVVNFVIDGEVEQVPILVVGDLRTENSLDEVRIYCYYKYVPGLTPYRLPMFEPAHLEAADPMLLTGSMREYYIALHLMPHGDVDRIMSTLSKDCVVGGYKLLEEGEEEPCTTEAVRAKFDLICSYMPACVGIRFETIIDDGKTCVIEWVHIVSEKGQKELDRVSLSGIASYERDDDGLLRSIRICDYAHHEKEIDWSKTPISKEDAFARNLVKDFPATVGKKALK